MILLNNFRRNIFLLTVCSLFSTLGFAQSIKIDSIKTTNSRCEYSGTLKVYASLGSNNTINYRYQIIAPANSVRSLQTGNEFTALSANTYEVVAIDIINGSSDTLSAVITGNYQQMAPSVTFMNGDCIAEGASATIGVTGGLPPYSYQITSPSTGLVQTSNVFNHPTYNTPYIIRVFDSCGNFQSRTITPVTNDIGAYSVTLGCLKWLACDSFSLSYTINTVDASNHKYPYTLNFNNPDGSISTSTITSGSANGTLADTSGLKELHRTLWA